jgi:hypothetical protein
VTDRVAAHADFLYVSFPAEQLTRRDCLTAEPWASESARQIPPLLAPRIVTQLHFNFGARPRNDRVWHWTFFPPQSPCASTGMRFHCN